jgi:F-type H+-transporting ATPase subunit b
VKRRILLAAASVAFAAGLAWTPVAHAQELTKGAAQAQAEEDRAEESHNRLFWWNVINFVILAGILGYMVKKSAVPMLKARTEEIQRAMLEASKAKQEADKRVGEMERRITGLGAEIERLRTQMRHEMAAEGERIRQETEHHLRRISEQAGQEIESLTKNALRQLKMYSAELALKSAEEQLKGRVNRDVENNLVSSFIADLDADLLADGIRSTNN